MTLNLKKYITFNILISALLFSCIASGQTKDTLNTLPSFYGKEKNVSDIQDLTKGGFNFWQDKFEGHFAGVDFGFNTFLNTDYSKYPEAGEFMENDFFRSNTLYINFLQQNISLQNNRNTIGLVTGLGMKFQSYRFNKNGTIEKNSFDRIIPNNLFFDVNQKSKLSIVSLVIPVLAEFQVPINHYANRFYVSTGFYGGIFLSSHTKIKYRSDGKKKKLKTPDDFSIRKFRTGTMIRLGYRWVNVFATYDLVPLFEDNSGPDLTPFSVGITLISF